MKKAIVTILAAAVCIFAANAQDADILKAATEAYNQGAEALNLGDNAGALKLFNNALTQAEQAGESGAEVAGNCKDIIPKLLLQIGKDYIKANQFDEAIKTLGEAAEAATKFGNNEDIPGEVEQILPGINLKKASNLVKEKNFAEAIVILKDVVAKTPENGNAHILLANCYNATGNKAEAINSFIAAKDNGQEKQAAKALSNIYLKDCQAAIKAKSYKAAIEAAEKSYEYLPNSNALKLAGNASLQLKDNDKAIEYFTKYIEEAPNAKDFSQICYNIASIYQGKGNKAKAIEFYEKVNPADPAVGAYAVQQLEALRK
ncbi:MAG: tetratricopeptide repeat protein [Bacteroidales bacterium]|nr:tetratricopeptide repeat protein [Bacteroidales bacterium]